MAEIVYAERQVIKGDQPKLASVDALYDGRIHTIKVYEGDTRADTIKAAAIKECLALRVEAEAIKLGRPIPEKEGVVQK